MPRIPLNLLALGTAAVTAVAWFQTHSVWKSAVASLSCATVAFGQKIWSELEPQWVKRIATWLDGWASTLLAGYSKRYFKNLYFKHKTVDLRGFSIQGKFPLELESLYVDLFVDSAVAREIDQDALSWRLRRQPTTGKDIFAWLRAHREGGNNFAILGPPGSGKTTLLKHVTLAFAARKTPHRLTPILLQLRELAHAIGLDPDITLVHLVEQTLKELPPPPRWFERRLNKGKCLIMLDGLDEVGDVELRRKVVAWVERTVVTHWQNSFLVTSRPNGYRDNPIVSFTVLRVLPFDRSQSARFIDNWYLAHKIGQHQKDDAVVRAEARKESEDLREWLRKMPGLRDLGVNPLLLTLIATVHLYRGRLPGRRVELYYEICDVFLGKRQQARGQDVVLTSAQSIRVLRVLANAMMVRELREIPEQEACEIIAPVLVEVHPEFAPLNFLAGVEDSSGLFSQPEARIYSFAHLTFQEYLCSLHVKEEGQGADLAERIDQEWWHETARFYCAQADGSQIVERCIASEPPDVRKLMLATDCEVDAFQLRADLRLRLRQITSDAVEHEEAARRKIAAELMLARRDRNLVAVADDRYVDSAPLSCAEYQLFIDARAEQGDFRQPDHWKRYQFAPNTGRFPIEGIRVNDQDEFCAWLTARSTSEWRYIPAERSDVSSLTIDWKQWENIDFFRSGMKSSPRLAGRTIVERLKEELDSPWWPPTTGAVRRLASLVVWMTMSEFQTEDNRIRFHSMHVEELGLMLDELLLERRLEPKTDLSSIAAKTKHLRRLISELWADGSMVQQFSAALDKDVAIAHTRNLEGEEAYPESRRMRRELAEGIALDEGIRREEAPVLDTFDLYRFIAADFKAFGREAEKKATFYRVARLLEEQSTGTLNSNRDESNWGIWIARHQVVQKVGALLSSDLLTTISAGARRARKRVRGGKVSLVLKRVLDVTVSAILLILLAPMFAAIAIAIKVGSPGPVFFLSPRLGRNARIFQCVKFRTMVVNAESLNKNLAALNEGEGTLFKLESDPRVTKVGKVLRKHGLDLLPQFLNVLRGEMSLVGPRPEIASELVRYELTRFRRLEVLPGLTGLWQVRARQDSSFEAYMRLDIDYVENRSLRMDLKILWQTIGLSFAGTRL